MHGRICKAEEACRGSAQLESQPHRLLGAIVKPTDIETADDRYRVNQDDHLPRHLRALICNCHCFLQAQLKPRSAVCQQSAVSFGTLYIAVLGNPTSYTHIKPAEKGLGVTRLCKPFPVKGYSATERSRSRKPGLSNKYAASRFLYLCSVSVPA